MTREEIKEMIDKAIKDRFDINKNESIISQYEATRCTESYTPATCLAIAEDIISMLSDNIDYRDVQSILMALSSGDSFCDVGAWCIHFFITDAHKSEKLTFSQIARAVYYSTTKEQYIEFFNEVQIWTKKALNEMGENTDV